MSSCVLFFTPSGFWLDVAQEATCEQAEESLEGSAECVEKSDGDMATSQVSIDRSVIHVSWTETHRHPACLLLQHSWQAGWRVLVHTAVTMDGVGYCCLCACG